MSPIALDDDTSRRLSKHSQRRQRGELHQAAEQLLSFIFRPVTRLQSAEDVNIARLEPRSHVGGNRDEVHAEASKSLQDAMRQVNRAGIHAKEDMSRTRDRFQGLAHFI